MGLSGTGQPVDTMLSLEYPALVFPAQTVGSASNQLSNYIYNTGDAAVTFTGIAITGGNASDFSITSNQCGAAPFVLNAGSDCYVYVTFAPSATGIRQSSLQYTDSVTGSPQNVSLVGIGVAANPPITLSPTDTYFATQVIGTTSTTSEIQVYNPGATSVTLAIALAGTNASDFSINSNTCGTTLAATSYCYVNITFKPTAAGTRVAAVKFTVNSTTVVDSGLVGTGAAGTQTLTTTQLAVDFGASDVGVTSSQQYVQVNNIGTETVTFSGFTIGGPDPGDFTISNNNCSSTLTAGASCYVYLTFTPTATNVRTATLQIADNATGSPQSVPLSGAGQANTETLNLPPSVTFAVTPVGVAETQYVYVYNLGTATVTVSASMLTGTNAADYSLTQNYCTGGGSQIDPGGYCYYLVTFTPSSSGLRTAAIQLTDTATGSPQSIPLGGYGEAATATLIFPQALSFPVSQVGVSESQYFYVVNSGNLPVTFTAFTIGGTNATDFVVGTNQCSTVYPGTSCYIYITFTPSASGARAANIQFTDNATGSPQGVSLYGMGEANTEILSFTPSVSFPATTVGSSSNPTPVYTYVYNIGSSPVTLNNIAIGGTNPGDFSTTYSSCSIGTTISPGTDCYLYFTFTPTASGNRSATLQLTDTASGSPQSISLFGVGQAVTTTVSISPSAYNFGVVTVGNSSDAYAYIYNTGTGTVTITNVAIAGTNAGDFSIGYNDCPAGTQLSSGSSCYVLLYFTPTATSARTASLQFTDNAVGGTQSATLTGVGQ